MLPNVAPIWETMLACIKLGAVIIPSATQLTKDDLQDQLTRGDVRHVATTPAGAELFSGLQGQYTRTVAGGKVAGWNSFEDAYKVSADFKPACEALFFRLHPIHIERIHSEYR